MLKYLKSVFSNNLGTGSLGEEEKSFITSFLENKIKEEKVFHDKKPSSKDIFTEDYFERSRNFDLSGVDSGKRVGREYFNIGSSKYRSDPILFNKMYAVFDKVFKQNFAYIHVFSI